MKEYIDKTKIKNMILMVFMWKSCCTIGNWSEQTVKKFIFHGIFSLETSPKLILATFINDFCCILKGIKSRNSAFKIVLLT